jgi:hypothetical protein
MRSYFSVTTGSQFSKFLPNILSFHPLAVAVLLLCCFSLGLLSYLHSELCVCGRFYKSFSQFIVLSFLLENSLSLCLPDGFHGFLSTISSSYWIHSFSLLPSTVHIIQKQKFTKHATALHYRAFKITGFVVLCKFHQMATPIQGYVVRFGHCSVFLIPDSR